MSQYVPLATYSRSALYDLVWVEPMLKVAQDIGISDVALKKACKKHNIPTPGRGYWARLAAKQNVKGIPLPPGEDVEIPFYGAALRYESVAPVESRVVKSEELKARPLLPALKATRDATRAAKPHQDGYLHIAGAGIFSMRISRATSERALALINALLILGEAEQIFVSKTPGHLDVKGSLVDAKLVERAEGDPGPTRSRGADLSAGKRNSLGAIQTLFKLPKRRPQILTLTKSH